MPTPRFQVSSYCHMSGCVAVALLPDGRIVVRDEKAPDGPALTFTSAEWDAFVAGVKNDEFDTASLS